MPHLCPTQLGRKGATQGPGLIVAVRQRVLELLGETESEA